MTNLEKVKALIKFDSLKRLLKEEAKISYNFVEDAEKLFMAKTGFNLSNGVSTTPKRLYGKPYKDLSKSELAEYTQIKRLIKRHYGKK